MKKIEKTSNVIKLSNFKPILYILPAFIFVIVFTFWPFLRSIIFSFFRVTRLGDVREFVGLDNYLKVLSDPTFHAALKNSFIFTLIATPITLIIALGLALLANKKRKLSVVYETMYAITMAISTSVAAMIFQLMYNPNLGILNQWLNTDIRWLQNPNISLFALMIIWIWMNIGFNFLFLLSAVRGINKEMLESADLDGAVGWTRLRKIIIPSISPVLFFLTTTQFTANIMMNALVLILTQGGPKNSTQTIMYYMISQGAQNANLNVGYASSVIIFIIVAIFISGIIKLLEKRVFYK